MSHDTTWLHTRGMFQEAWIKLCDSGTAHTTHGQCFTAPVQCLGICWVMIMQQEKMQESQDSTSPQVCDGVKPLKANGSPVCSVPGQTISHLIRTSATLSFGDIMQQITSKMRCADQYSTMHISVLFGSCACTVDRGVYGMYSMS